MSSYPCAWRMGDAGLESPENCWNPFSRRLRELLANVFHFSGHACRRNISSQGRFSPVPFLREGIEQRILTHICRMVDQCRSHNPSQNPHRDCRSCPNQQDFAQAVFMNAAATDFKRKIDQENPVILLAHTLYGEQPVARMMAHPGERRARAHDT